MYLYIYIYIYVYSIFTSRCASRRKRVHFLNVWTGKSAPNLRCFVRFEFRTCFAPQRRPLFQQLNLQKWSENENGVFSTFSLRHASLATVACNFRHLNFQKRSDLGCFAIFWRPNALQMALHAPAALVSLLFDLPEPQSIGRTRCFASSYLFAALTCFLLPFTLTRPTSAFPSVHIVGSLTSNLTFKRKKTSQFTSVSFFTNFYHTHFPLGSGRSVQAGRRQSRPLLGSRLEKGESHKGWVVQGNDLAAMIRIFFGISYVDILIITIM